jgi:hypothetical protein
VSTRRFLVASLLLFSLLTCVMTYPQIFHLRDSVHDEGDPLLNAWTLAWVAHQLPRAPARLFDANIFYPERRTLAFSETLLLPALVMAPLRWAGAGPVLVYNIVLLSGFVLSGVGVALLVRTLTGSIGPALLAGIVFAFLPFRIDHYAHVQLQQIECLPFALWAFHRLLARGRVHDGVLFGGFAAGQLLSCVYYGLLMIPYLAVVCASLLIATSRGADVQRRDRHVATAIVVAIAIVVVAAVPVGMAYLGARNVVGERGREEVVNGSATLTDYLGPAQDNALYGRTLAGFARHERRLFPGFVAVALAAVGLWPRRGRGAGPAGLAGSPGDAGRVQLGYALGLLIAFDVSLGYHGLTYPLLYEYFVPFRALRIPARNGIIVGLSLAVLAGFGAARVAALARSPAARRFVLLAIGALMLVEYASRPIPLMAMPLKPPSAYDVVLRDKGDSPTTAIFELPLSSKDDPTYMYFSTFHWQHLVNGYSGFFPPSYVFLANAMEEGPDNAAIHAIKSHGTRYLLVHGERMRRGEYDALLARLDARPELALIAKTPAVPENEHGEISVYRVSYVEVR